MSQPAAGERRAIVPFREIFALDVRSLAVFRLGLAMMVFLSLLPAGIYQAWASVTKGLWYARSPEVIHSQLMETLVWLRVPGDVVFAAGAVVLAWYALRLLRRPARPAAVPQVAPSAA